MAKFARHDAREGGLFDKLQPNFFLMRTRPGGRGTWVSVDAGFGRGSLLQEDSYLVDPASSHMLVSKIKPCMSKYNYLYWETANGSLNQL